jgi:threonine dehydrogenase-like Zn-dependent dehydrogenase
MGCSPYNKGDFKEITKAIEDGRIKPGAMITRKIALDKVEDKGFRALIEKDLHKILVDMEKR